MIYIEIDKNNKLKYSNRDYKAIGKTDEELLETGYFVEEIPEIVPVLGKDGMLYFDPETNEFSTKYVDRPLSEYEEIVNLKAQNAQMLLALVEGGLM